MILIDALFINKGGGKTLLKCFIDNLPNNMSDLVFLLDIRAYEEFKHLNINAHYLKPSIIDRHFFYMRYKEKFSLVFTFANLPPTLKLKCHVISFFQNVLYINENFSSISMELKKFFFRLLVPNVNVFIVQSAYVKKILQKKIGYSYEISILPFFEEVSIPKPKPSGYWDSRNEVKFIYPSSGENYKNHIRLLNAFEIVSRESSNFSLVVTVGSEYSLLISKIQELNDKKVNVINLGEVSRKDLFSEYSSADICIYPSLLESFGLGLIEAVQFGLPVFAANLPYVKEVVEPSCFFDPLDEKAIASTMLNFQKYVIKDSKIITNNSLNSIFDLLKLHSR
jgi:glycosyltransferase involved in cell wall biosynthesis